MTTVSWPRILIAIAMVKGFFITAILVALSFGQALAGEPRESAPELAVGPQFLDLSRDGNGQDDGQPLFDLNMGRETLWLDFEQAPFDQRRSAPLTPPDAIVDVYPFDGNLRFTGGMIYDNSAFGSDPRGPTHVAVSTSYPHYPHRKHPADGKSAASSTGPLVATGSSPCRARDPGTAARRCAPWRADHRRGRPAPRRRRR